MKKTKKLVLFVCLALLACVLIFTACEHVHSFTEWTVTKAATCTTDGIKERDCSCGETETRDIPATGHTWSQWTTVTEATCTTDGTEKRDCSCGETETRTVTSKGHTWSKWTATTEATCTADGSEKRNCSCGETETRTVSAKGHTWKAATCTTAKTCTKCNLTEGAALGHTTSAGICSRCDEEIKPTITLPNTPISTSYKSGSNRSTMKITSITYEFDDDDIKFYYSGEKTYDTIPYQNGKYMCGFTYKLYDADGYVIDSSTEAVFDISVGDKFRNEYFKIYNVAPSSSYRLVIEDLK